MQTFFAEISKWRSELEEQSVDGGTTTDAIQLITYVQQLKKKTKACQEKASLLFKNRIESKISPHFLSTFFSHHYNAHVCYNS